jgi:hypothetical protein
MFNLELIVEEFNSNLSPYMFCKKMNKVLGTNLPPQMFYNYIIKGYLKSEVNELGKKFVTPEVQQDFVTKYVTKKVEKVTEEVA